jgi:NitT/TauT family transport system substrate-binding protein
VAALAGAGCSGGSDDDGGSASSSTDAAEGQRLRFPDDDAIAEGDDDGDGCGDASRTVPDDMAANRTVARCAAGSPAAVPLPGPPTTLRVGIRGATEDLAPLLLADRLGELEAENLAVELVTYEDAGSLFAALDAGEVDAVAGDLDAPFFDLVSEHDLAGTAGPRLIMGGAIAARPNDLSTPQPGFWVRPGALEEPDKWADLEDQRVAVEDSIGDVVAQPITALLRQDDISLNEVRLSVVGGQEAAEGLAAGDLAAAWLSEPYWREVADDEQIELAATLPAAESLGGIVAGPALAVDDREVAVAFSRALIRTVNTYLAGDYQDDDEVMDALADATGQTVEELRATPAWVFDWELRAGTTSRIQTPLINYGAVVYEAELPESDMVDREIYRSALEPPPDQP